MIQAISQRKPALVLLLAFALVFAGCGDSDEEPAGDGAPASEETSTDAGLDPAAVEASVQEFLDADEYASGLSPNVDCGDEQAESLECTITGDKGLTGTVLASPSQGFEYTGQIETPDGPSSLGGSASEGTLADPASIEESLNEALSDEAGEPTAECPDAAEDASLECEVTGDDVSGTLTVTAPGGFEWEGQIETPDGTRGIGANELP